MSDPDSVVVHLLDKEYRVACPPGERDNLRDAARYLDEQMREVRESNVIGLERIAVMTAINLAYELLQARNALRQQEDQGSLISNMLGKVEAELQALEEDGRTSGT